MTASIPRIHCVAPVWITHLEHADRHLATLAERFLALRDDPQTRTSHWFEQRFENIYIDRERLPELTPVATEVLACAKSILDRSELKYGFWFNEMKPGDRTTLHDHHEDDELLSAVLYLTAPVGSGDLLLHDEPATVRVSPQAGRMVLFPPDLPHEVETNRSGSNRLSIAFNFGPVGAP
jgi:hypothetical protein